MGPSWRAQLRIAGINEDGIDRGRSYNLQQPISLRNPTTCSTQAIRQQTLTKIKNRVYM